MVWRRRYVDVVKFDVEGGEWRTRFIPCSTRPWSIFIGKHISLFEDLIMLHS